MKANIIRENAKIYEGSFVFAFVFVFASCACIIIRHNTIPEGRKVSIKSINYSKFFPETCVSSNDIAYPIDT